MNVDPENPLCNFCNQSLRGNHSYVETLSYFHENPRGETIQPTLEKSEGDSRKSGACTLAALIIGLVIGKFAWKDKNKSRIYKNTQNAKIKKTTRMYIL